MKISFQAKLTIGFDIVLIIFAALIVNFFYSKAHYVHRDNLRSRLIGIAATAALMVDGDKHDLLQEPSDDGHPAFEELRTALTRVKTANPGITYIYTMRKTRDPNMFQFVIDEAEEEDSNGNGIIDEDEETAEIGEPYDVSSYPELRAAYEGPRADLILQSDQWGTWLSGYAPIYNSKNEAIGILGVDMAAGDVRAEEGKLVRTAVLILGGAIIGSVIIGYLLARHFTEPIRKLLNAIQKVARGNLKTRIDIKRRDEIGLLGKAFNTMAENLDLSRRKLDEYNRLLEEKVKERTRELQEAQEAVVYSEKMAAVGALAGGVAHEFNNLFASIRGHAEIAISTADPERKNKALKLALRSADRAKKITTALLAYSREGGKLAYEKIDLIEVLELSLGLLKRDLNRFNIMVNKDYNPIPAIWGSSDQLQHALGNILANAKDAMIETGGLLTISTSLKDDKVSIQINDTGPGIEPEMLEKIFEPFRGSKGILAGGRAGYAGLGLFAALGVIRSHRGEIKVESKPGEGATFTVILPLPSRSPLEELLPRKTAARPSRLSPGRRGVNKILLADDEEDIADFLQQFLEEKGFLVDIARSGREAVRRARKEDYGLIFMDVAMPDMDGETAIEEIINFKPEMRFVIISGYSPYEFPDDLMSNIVDYLQKPFSLSQIASAAFKVFAREKPG